MLACGVAFLSVLAIGDQAPASAPVASSTPAASRPVETVSQQLARLSTTAPADASKHDLALRAGLQFCLAVAAADARRALECLDATGYQPLPLRGPLLDEPGKPIGAAAMRIRIEQQPHAALGAEPAGRFAALQRRAAAELFPGVARWMLDDDWAIVFTPGGALPNWSQDSCCVVVRVRATRATVIGGNLFAALEAAP
ncbi:MAG: hypothetical protein HRF50_01275 [Phycisphaerae bacterium]